MAQAAKKPVDWKNPRSISSFWDRKQHNHIVSGIDRIKNGIGIVCENRNKVKYIFMGETDSSYFIGSSIGGTSHTEKGLLLLEIVTFKTHSLEQMWRCLKCKSFMR